MGGDLGRFQQNRVSSGDRADRRGQQQVQGVVPCTDDQDHTQGVLADVDIVKLVDDTCLDGTVCGPLVEVLDGIDTFLLDHARFTDHQLCWGLVEVLENSLADGGVILGDHVVHGSELLLAVVQRPGDTSVEGRPKSLDDLLKVVEGGMSE